MVSKMHHLSSRQACVRAITVDGLDNIIVVRNILSEYLNVVVSTNTMKHALHKLSLH